MLWLGLRTMARNAGAFALFLGLDVAGQAILVWAVPIESATRALWISSLVLSALWHLLCAVFMLAVAVEGTRSGRRVRLRHAWIAGSAAAPFVAVTLVLVGGLVAAGLALYTWLGVAAMLALGFVPLAAAAGARNPFAAGLTALARNPLRYAWSVVVLGAVFAVVAVAVALVALYWPTPLAQVVVLVGEGAVLLWLACSLAPLLIDGLGADG